MSVFRKITVFNKFDSEWHSIITVIFVLLFLVLLLISFSLYLNICDLNDTVYQKTLDLLSFHTIDEIEDSLKPYDQIIFIAENIDRSAIGDISLLNNTARDILTKYPELEFLSIINNNGTIVAKKRIKDAIISTNTSLDNNISWYQGVKDSASIYWSKAYVPFDDGMPYLTAAYPIYGSEGAFLGALGLNFSLDKISSALDIRDYIDSGELFIFGPDHQIISYRDLSNNNNGIPDELLSQRIDVYTNKYIDQGNDDYFSFRYKSINYYAAFIPLNKVFDNKWILGIVIEGETFLPKIDHIRWLSVVIYIPLLLLVLFYIFHKVEQKGIDDRLIKIATTDQLTNLSNRYSFNNYFSYLRKRTLDFDFTFSIAMADIDYFKEINDEYGHSAGDYVLSEIGHLFKRELRNLDYICRWGGEEFLILLTSTSNFHAKNVAEKLRVSVKNHQFVYDGRQIAVTISIGVTENDNRLTCDELVGKADRLLYQAKTSGRDRVVID